jgi:phosphatidate cytidylyltransferase
VVFLIAKYPAEAVLAVLAMILMTVQLRVNDFSKALPSVGVTLLGVVYIFGAWRCALLIREYSPLLLMIPLLTSWVGDTAAMYAGKAWGKEKLAPRISPGKTQVGAVASVITGALASAILVVFTNAPMQWPEALILGAIANVAGQIGDLCESAFKRGAGLKDSGTMLPGHGGWLDRIDASLFSIPAFYAAWQLWP